MSPRTVPSGVPKLPADLERHDRFARSRRHSKQDPPLPLQHGLDDTVGGDLLIVARALTGQVVRGREQPLRRRLIDLLPHPQPLPKLSRRGEKVQLLLHPVQVVELHDAVTVGRIGKL